MDLIWGEGHWYKSGGGLVPVRWVFVHDITGTHRDEYFYCTDPATPPQKIVSLYTQRWSIEVTFQEVRATWDWPRSAIGRPRACCEPRHACWDCSVL